MTAIGLQVGFALDRRWHWLRGEMEKTKQPVLAALANILATHDVRYAVIGGIALQVHQSEPRTTLDIDVAILDYALLPRPALEDAGFRCTGRYSHPENWVAADGTPVRFTDDPSLAPAIRAAVPVDLQGGVLHVIRPVDLLHAKLQAAADSARRRSKRLQDLADAHALLEQFPDLRGELSAAEARRLEQLPE
jgi:hypothetical protein